MSRPSDLRRDWYAPIRRLTDRPGPYSPRQALSCAAVASSFVHRWAHWAERIGMQPAHLLSYRNRSGRGLAWRYVDIGSISVVAFPARHRIVTEIEGLSLVYAFEADGRCTLIRGSERAELLGAQLELMAWPGARMGAMVG